MRRREIVMLKPQRREPGIAFDLARRQVLGEKRNSRFSIYHFHISFDISHLALSSRGEGGLVYKQITQITQMRKKGKGGRRQEAGGRRKTQLNAVKEV